MNYLCQECKDTGFIETQLIDIGRVYYCHEEKQLVHPVMMTNEFSMTVCPCLS